MSHETAQKIAPEILSSSQEDLCKYVADLSRQLADMVRHCGFEKMVEHLDLVEQEAKIILASSNEEEYP